MIYLSFQKAMDLITPLINDILTDEITDSDTLRQT